MDKIICVGKNYLRHAQELGDAINEEPLYFLKPPSTLFVAESGHDQIKIPANFEVHHELEWVFRISERGGRLELTHYTLGLDLTLRDLQFRLKKAGQPWEKAKVFKNSSVLGSWQPVLTMEEILKFPFQLKVNGEVRQTGRGTDMRWRPEELLKDVSHWFPVLDGDLLFTGTPEGVGPIKPGDRLDVSGGPIEYSLHCL